jgi:hypothetical protein
MKSCKISRLIEIYFIFIICSLTEIFAEDVNGTIEVRDGLVGVAYDEENADIYVTN